MRKLAAFLPAILFFVLASAASAQSLADLASKEKERREAVKNERVITKQEAAKYRSAPENVEPASDQPTGKPDTGENGGEAGAQSQTEKPGSDEPVDFQGRPESFWRQTMADARQRVKELENEANVLVLKQNDLHNKFYNYDNGFKRLEFQREIQKTYYEQDLNKENLAKAKAALQDLENEARKSGALPGWIEARKN